jgi:hypothetical protein
VGLAGGVGVDCLGSQPPDVVLVVDADVTGLVATVAVVAPQALNHSGIAMAIARRHTRVMRWPPSLAGRSAVADRTAKRLRGLLWRRK